MRGDELSDEMVVALGLDYTMGVRSDSPAVGGETREAMGITFQEEDATPDTPLITTSRENTPESDRSGKGPCLPSPAPSLGGDSNFYSEKVWSGFVHIKAKQPRCPIEETSNSMPSHVEGPPLEAETDWAKIKLLLAKRVRY